MSGWRSKDPHHKRELKKYGEALPSREYIMSVLGDADAPLGLDELCDALAYDEDTQLVLRRLRAMERDGQLLRNRRGTWGLASQMELIPARVTGHRDGYGFAIPDDGSDDLYLHARQMRLVLDGDRVLVRESGKDRRGRREGMIVEVLERSVSTVVGRYYREQGVGFVVPDNKRINHEVLIPESEGGNVTDGQIVVAEITQQPNGRSGPIGRINEVLGDHLAPGMEIEVAIRAHDLPHVWPEAVLKQSDVLPDEVPSGSDRGRVDLRELPLVTIDGEDARDFDDAVYSEPRARGGWRLLVAIADVSHYVRPGSALDREAIQRGNSVYFPGQVVPMLPEKLSNGLCSLNPDVERLCMVADLRLTAKGKLTGFEFYEGIMRSHARLTYTQVGAWLENPDSRAGRSFANKHPDLGEAVSNLSQLYEVLRKARSRRGAIDFETTESRVLFGAGRKIERIVPVVRNDAHKIIEECMLCANVAAARFLEAHGLSGLYRIHDGPKAEKLESLREFLGEFGLSLGGGKKPAPADYQDLVARIDGRADQPLLQTVILRSMQQAVYSPDNIGHFGLAYEAYAHFTSPIRRYPDLLVHRAIRSVIRSKRQSEHVQRVRGAGQLKKEDIYPYTDADLDQLGEGCSMTERRADEATRDALDTLKCEYMLEHVGADFEGTISAVTGFGLFVQLDEVLVDGLVHITSLKSDYYRFDATGHRLIGERSGQVYRLGDRVRALVARVDVDDRKIDLELQTLPRRRGKGGAAEPVRERQSAGRSGRTGKRSGKRSGGKAAGGAAKPAGSKKGGSNARKRGGRK